MNKKRCLLATLFVAVALLASTPLQASLMVPPDLRVNTDWSNIGELANYDAVQQIGFVSRPWGYVKFEDTTSVPTGWRLWFLDDGMQPAGWTPPPQFLIGMQPIGVMDVDLNHTYVFTTSIAIRGDDNFTTNVDEGANMNSLLTVIGQNLSTNTFYYGGFKDGVVYYQSSDMSRHDVIIDRNSPITAVPAPSGIVLSLLGLVCCLVGKARTRQWF